MMTVFQTRRSSRGKVLFLLPGLLLLAATQVSAGEADPREVPVCPPPVLLAKKVNIPTPLARIQYVLAANVTQHPTLELTVVVPDAGTNSAVFVCGPQVFLSEVNYTEIYHFPLSTFMPVGSVFVIVRDVDVLPGGGNIDVRATLGGADDIRTLYLDIVDAP